MERSIFFLLLFFSFTPAHPAIVNWTMNTLAMGPTANLLLIAPWARAAFTASLPLLDTSNLKECQPAVNYCSSRFAEGGLRGPLHVLVECANKTTSRCRYRCPLGHPLLQIGFKGGRRCGSPCPPGYFVGDYQNHEACLPYTRTCPPGQRVILRSTSWHDTICGSPEDYATPAELSGLLKEGVLREKLKDLALIWIRALHEADATKLCESYFSEYAPEDCKYRLETLLFDWQVEKIYSSLNEISAFHTASAMYSSVVVPFRPYQPGPMLRFLFKQPNPWWARDGETIVIQGKLVIPEGMSGRYVLRELVWYRGLSSSPTSQAVLKAGKESISTVDSRFSLVSGLGWRKTYTRGFFVRMFDISLVVENFYCGMFEAVHVRVHLYDKHEKRLKTMVYNPGDIRCIWKPGLPAGCKCTRALLDYTNPDGPCSPTCVSRPFAHLSKGLEGNNDDWTLQITHGGDPEPSSGGGRVLYGSFTPKTERFCLVTKDIFSLSPGPARDSPSAPLDVVKCEVVLVDFHVWLQDLPPGEDERRYSTVAVRPLRDEDQNPRLYIPLAARDTLDTVVSRGWGGKIGIKFGFSRSTRSGPRQQEILAVLNTVLASWGHEASVRVAVIDVDIETVKSSDFVVLNHLYGSKLELIPGLSANTLADAIRDRRRTEYNYIKCRSSIERCSRLVAAYDRREKVVYRRLVSSHVPECNKTPASSQRCVACWDRGEEFAHFILICPSHLDFTRLSDDNGALLIFGAHELPVRGHDCTRLCPLSPEQVRAETTLRELGLLVASRGAFLNLDNVSVFPPQSKGSGRVRPARWTLGKYTAEDPYALKLPEFKDYPERTGLLVFEELCRRSNNRGGIVVSVPSADYVPGPGDQTVRLINRHIADHGGGERVRYSVSDLARIISDMAKWGVCRYSLGYLDYTFGNSRGAPTFVELSQLISAAAARIRTLHYRYTRHSAFGDGGSSFAHVDGVYKLEGGMFFQRVTEETPLAKSFARVPDVPNLRLGISSDMNVGAPLTPVGELIALDTIETVESVPPGARVVSLNHKDAVAFVDRDRDRICVHSLSAAVEARSEEPVRLPSFGVRSVRQEGREEDEIRLPPCRSHVSGARYRARVSVPVPITSESKESVLRSVSDMSRWFGAPALTREEREWLSGGEALADNRVGLPRPPRGAQNGSISTLDSVYLISKTVECLRGSSSCVDLGDYSDNRWPGGGTGYPIAIVPIVSESSDKILLKLILRVNHGAVPVRIPCDWKPFSFGPGQLDSSLHPTEGYYTRTEEPQIDKAKRYVTTAGSLAAGIVRSVASLFCLDAVESLGDHLPSSETHLRKTNECVSVANERLWDFQETLSHLDLVSEENRKAAEFRVKRLAYIAGSRTQALCLSSLVLTILINVALIATLRSLCNWGPYQQQQHRRNRKVR